MTNNELFNLEKKVIVITGATGVLAGMIGRYLAKQGATIVLLARKKELGMQMVEEIEEAGGKAYFFESDVLNESMLRQNLVDILTTCGSIDILINAAGGNMPGANVMPEQSFADLDLDAFKQVVDLNFYGCFLPTQIFSTAMIRNQKGIIINFTSATVERPMTRVVGYSAAKAAVANFTQWLSVEFAQKYGNQMRVNNISPGFFLTEQNRKLLTQPDGTYTERGNKIINNTPMQRLGNPNDLCGAIHWLCSDASAFVTGQTIVVDGGFDAYAGV